ncbi:MAG: TadE/TadG family type IV pilus assembly protein [Acidimicrobiales bacterium]
MAERGSASAELVLLTPLVVAIIGLMFGAGRMLLERQQIVEVARTAVQAAVVSATPAGAQAAAAGDARSVLASEGAGCSPLEVATDVSSFVPGGSVTVTIGCTVALHRVAFAGLPGEVFVSSTDKAVVEPFRVIGS